jgi:hypothetical protein
LALIASDISRPVITLAPTALNGTRCKRAASTHDGFAALAGDGQAKQVEAVSGNARNRLM